MFGKGFKQQIVGFVIIIILNLVLIGVIPVVYFGGERILNFLNRKKTETEKTPSYRIMALILGVIFILVPLAGIYLLQEGATAQIVAVVLFLWYLSNAWYAAFHVGNMVLPTHPNKKKK